jgi:hypothetical protein
MSDGGMVVDDGLIIQRSGLSCSSRRPRCSCVVSSPRRRILQNSRFKTTEEERINIIEKTRTRKEKKTIIRNKHRDADRDQGTLWRVRF